MSLPNSDDFNRADGGVGASYTNSGSLGGFNVVANRVAGATTGQNLVFRNTDVYPNNSYSEIDLIVLDSGNGPAARVDASGNGYVIAGSATTFDLYKFIAGTPSLIAGNSVSVSSGARARLEPSGSTLTLKKDGSVVGTPQTDSAIPSGSAGFYGFNSNGTMDNFASGTLDAAAAVVVNLYRRSSRPRPFAPGLAR